MKNTDILFLFDVDGTLSPSRDVAPDKIINMLKELKKRVNIGFVGGSDLSKQIEQIGSDLLDIFDYGFPENGLQFYDHGKLCKSESIIGYLSEATYLKIANKILFLLSQIECPKKRGNFIELRNSMINVCPVGRTCTREERNEFFDYDNKHGIRKKLAAEMNKEFKQYKLQCVIGGQISIDVFPVGWDKTYCLNHVKEGTIVFFGDMTAEGGNDYEISRHPRVKGITVKNPDDTFNKVNEELDILKISKIK